MDVLIVENVGNLVCPAEFRIGEDARIMVCSVTEGEDKPLKYPLMFRACELVVINKVDLLQYLDFDVDRLEANILQVNPQATVMRVSAKTGEGVEAFRDWLKALPARFFEDDDHDHEHGEHTHTHEHGDARPRRARPRTTTSPPRREAGARVTSRPDHRHRRRARRGAAARAQRGQRAASSPPRPSASRGCATRWPSASRARAVSWRSARRRPTAPTRATSRSSSSIR